MSGQFSEDAFHVDLTTLCQNIAGFVKEKGFYTPSSLDEPEQVLAKLMLVVTEMAEAAEAVRRQDHTNFEEELADTLIRIFDLCGTMGIDIGAQIADKMEINMGRPYKHGKVY